MYDTSEGRASFPLIHRRKASHVTSFESPFATIPAQPETLVVTVMFAVPEGQTLRQARVLQAGQAVKATLEGARMATFIGFEVSDEGPVLYRYRVSEGVDAGVVHGLVEATCALIDVPHTVGLESTDAPLADLDPDYFVDDEEEGSILDEGWLPPPFPYDAPPL